MPELDRITQDPSVMGGKPCIRGMRVTVGMVVGQIGAGHTIEEVLSDYPYLDREDILQAQCFLTSNFLPPTSKSFPQSVRMAFQ